MTKFKIKTTNMKVVCVGVMYSGEYDVCGVTPQTKYE
jgi:hypothetical protein